MNLLPAIQAHIQCRLTALAKDPNPCHQAIRELQTVNELCEAFNRQAHLFDDLTAKILFPKPK